MTILLFHLISSHHFSGHCLWRLSFLLFGHRQWRPLSFYITASFIWAPTVATQFSCLSDSELYVRAPSGATLLCHLSSLPHLTGLRLWRLSFLFCHILHTHTCVHTYIQTYIHTTYTHIFVKLGHRLWRFSFLLCHSTYIHAYIQKCVCFLFISLQHFSVHRLFATQFSVVRADCCQRAGGTDHSMPRDYIQQ